MRRRAAFAFAILASASCGKSETAGNEPQAPIAESIAPLAADVGDPLVDTAWTLTPGDGRPGVVRIFLSDGVLFQGSCVETYRLSSWRRISDSRIAWNEDGVDIEADAAVSDTAMLTLVLHLPSEEKTETYRRTDAPFVCPDMPR